MHIDVRLHIREVQMLADVKGGANELIKTFNAETHQADAEIVRLGAETSKLASALASAREERAAAAQASDRIIDLLQQADIKNIDLQAQVVYSRREAQDYRLSSEQLAEELRQKEAAWEATFAENAGRAAENEQLKLRLIATEQATHRIDADLRREIEAKQRKIEEMRDNHFRTHSQMVKGQEELREQLAKVRQGIGLEAPSPFAAVGQMLQQAQPRREGLNVTAHFRHPEVAHDFFHWLTQMCGAAPNLMREKEPVYLDDNGDDAA